jgi:hypothetical protein
LHSIVIILIPFLTSANLFFRRDECLIEPPLKKVKSSTVPAASEASAPAAAPTAQLSTASSLSKGKDIPLAAATPSSGKPVSLFLFQRKLS